MVWFPAPYQVRGRLFAGMTVGARAWRGLRGVVCGYADEAMAGRWQALAAPYRKVTSTSLRRRMGRVKGGS